MKKIMVILSLVLFVGTVRAADLSIDKLFCENDSGMSIELVSSKEMVLQRLAGKDGKEGMPIYGAMPEQKNVKRLELKKDGGTLFSTRLTSAKLINDFSSTSEGKKTIEISALSKLSAQSLKMEISLGVKSGNTFVTREDMDVSSTGSLYTCRVKFSQSEVY